MQAPSCWPHWPSPSITFRTATSEHLCNCLKIVYFALQKFDRAVTTARTNVATVHYGNGSSAGQSRMALNSWSSCRVPFRSLHSEYSWFPGGMGRGSRNVNRVGKKEKGDEQA